MTTLFAQSRGIGTDGIAGESSAALHWLFSTRSRRLFLLLVAVWIINAFDLTLTLLADRDGILHERNPIARALLSYGQVPVSLFKIGLVTAASLVLWRCRVHRCSELAAVLAVLIYAGVAFQWKDCYDTYDLTLADGGSVVQEAITERRIAPPTS